MLRQEALVFAQNLFWHSAQHPASQTVHTAGGGVTLVPLCGPQDFKPKVIVLPPALLPGVRTGHVFGLVSGVALVVQVD